MFVFEVFETGVELDAVDDFFPVAEGLASDADGVENVTNIVLDVSVVLDNVDDDVADSDDVDAVVATVVASVVVVGADDDVVDSAVDDVVAVVGTVVVNDVVGGVVSAVEVGRVVDVTVDDIVKLFRFPIVQPSVNLQHEQEVSPVFRLFNRESIIFSNHAEHASSLPIWPVKHNLTSDSSHDWL